MGWSADFAERVTARTVTVAVVGLGYVGWPTALGFRDAGFPVIGIDVSERRVQQCRTEVPESDGWTLTTDWATAIPNADVVLVTVPTPVLADHRPDLTYVRSAGESVFDHLAPGQHTIVVLESTVYPGVTEETWLPLLEQRGLGLGTDVDLAYCPERLNPGDAAHGVRQVARVVGAMDPAVGAGLVPLYEALTEGGVKQVGSVKVAESSKVVENVQRDLNIALVNELAIVFQALGIDLEEVLDAAATKWNFHRYTPGVGVGGHCIPVDPYYLIQRSTEAGIPTELISAGRAVNRAMPTHVAQTLIAWMARHSRLPDGARVLILGWAYKPELDDVRETPAEDLARALSQAGVEVLVHDPVIASDALDHEPAVRLLGDIEDAADVDAVVLVTAHQAILDLDFAALLGRMRTPLMYDGRRQLDLDGLAAMGWQVGAIGRPFAA